MEHIKELLDDPRKDDWMTTQAWQKDLFEAIYQQELSDTVIKKIFKQSSLTVSDLETDWKNYLGANDATDELSADDHNKAVWFIKEIKVFIITTSQSRLSSQGLVRFQQLSVKF